MWCGRTPIFVKQNEVVFFWFGFFFSFCKSILYGADYINEHRIKFL